MEQEQFVGFNVAGGDVGVRGGWVRQGGVAREVRIHPGGDGRYRSAPSAACREDRSRDRPLLLQ